MNETHTNQERQSARKADVGGGSGTVEPEQAAEERFTPREDPAPASARLLPIENLEMNLLLQLDACTLCGECLRWCPVYDQDQREEVVPRDKILNILTVLKSQHGLIARLLKNRKSGIFQILRRLLDIRDVTDEDLNNLAQYLYECSTCGQCQVVCPANIETVELWENVRQLLVRAGYGPLDNHKALVKSVKSYDNPWQQPRQGRTKWARRAKKSKLIQETPRDIKKSKGNVLLYFGCTAAYNANVQQIAINTVNIFEALDINYGCLLGAEKCCGSVLLRVGDPEYERLAQDNIKEFNSLNIDTLVTSCAGCFKTLKEDYPKVEALNFEVLHTVEYLQRLRHEGRLDFPNQVNRVVTYHDPCHLGRASGVFNAPRDIIRSIPGLTFIEMGRNNEYSRCCGAGGGVKAGFPVIQEKMALRRIQEAETTGAEELISCCPFCFAGLQVGIKASNSPLVMKDVTSLVAESLLGNQQPDKEKPEAKTKSGPQERSEATQE